MIFESEGERGGSWKSGRSSKGGCVNFMKSYPNVDKGKGDKKSKIFVDIINGSPLVAISPAAEDDDIGKGKKAAEQEIKEPQKVQQLSPPLRRHRPPMSASGPSRVLQGGRLTHLTRVI